MKQLVSILFVLGLLSCCTSEADRLRMRSGLDSLNQRNRNDQLFTIAEADSFVRFFDRHGTSNDRLLAHYLLGRAYHEHGEAPMAMECYQRAIEQADATSADCDYAQLSRVYAQMGLLFYQQNLFVHQIETNKKARYYADLGGSPLSAIIDLEQTISAYENLQQIDSALFMAEFVASWYHKNGYYQQEVIALGRIIPILIDRREYIKAKQLLDSYESNSCLFDDDGNIAKGREIFYHMKGRLYSCIGKLDSAEYFFRKELHDGRDFNNQNAAAMGLAQLYEYKDYPDSAAKYYKYAYAMNDSLYAKTATEDVEQMKALYDYSRHQEIARQKTELARHEKAKRQTLIWIFISLLIFVALAISHILRKKKNDLGKYRKNLIELHQLREEIAMLYKHEAEYSKMIAEKNQRIEQLQAINKKYGKQMFFTTANAERCLQESPSYIKIESKAVKGITLTEQDWEMIYALMDEYLPDFNNFLILNERFLKGAKRNICILLRLHFKAKQVAQMLDTSSANISQESGKILKIVFCKKGSTKELSSEISKIF